MSYLFGSRVRIIAVTVILFQCVSLSKAVTVEVRGEADLSQSDPERLALVDALRKAVQQGAGVEAFSETKVAALKLTSDEVLLRSFGHVKRYSILDRGKSLESAYVVIRADVGLGSPKLSDEMAVQLVIRRHGHPKTVISVKETLSGIEGSIGYLNDALKAYSTGIGMKIHTPGEAPDLVIKAIVECTYKHSKKPTRTSKYSTPVFDIGIKIQAVRQSDQRIYTHYSRDWFDVTAINPAIRSSGLLMEPISESEIRSAAKEAFQKKLKAENVVEMFFNKLFASWLLDVTYQDVSAKPAAEMPPITENKTLLAESPKTPLIVPNAVPATADKNSIDTKTMLTTLSPQKLPNQQPLVPTVLSITKGHWQSVAMPGKNFTAPISDRVSIKFQWMPATATSLGFWKSTELSGAQVFYLSGGVIGAQQDVASIRLSDVQEEYIAKQFRQHCHRHRFLPPQFSEVTFNGLAQRAQKKTSQISGCLFIQQRLVD